MWASPSSSQTSSKTEAYSRTSASCIYEVLELVDEDAEIPSRNICLHLVVAVERTVRIRHRHVEHFAFVAGNTLSDGKQITSCEESADNRTRRCRNYVTPGVKGS